MRKLLNSFCCVAATMFFINHSEAQSNVICTSVGTGIAGWSGDGGSATTARLNGPNILMVDPAGNLFISDASNSRIRMVNAAGIITEIGGNGTAGWAGDGGPATAAEFNNPSGFAMDGRGNLYVGDQYNHVLRKISPAVNGIVTTIAGTHGVSGFSGDGGPASAALFDRPYYLSFDSYHNLFIVDQYNHVIRKITAHADTIAATDTITTVVGHGTIIGFLGDGGPATGAYLNFPNCICIDAENNLYISDNGNQKIRKVNAHDTISTIAGIGTAGWAGDGGPAIDAELDYPVGIKMDGLGNFIFADGAGNRIRKINTSGIISTICGTGFGAYSGDGGPATAATINEPLDVAIDASNDILIADYGNNRVRMIKSECQLPVLSPIMGPKSGCPEERITLTDTATGGTWSGNDTLVATIVPHTGVVTCVAAGVERITYSVTNSCGSSVALDTISVNPYAGMITGADSLCPGDSIMLSNAITIGVWSSTDMSVATVNTVGIVTAVGAGIDTIRYIVSDSCGSDTASHAIMVGTCTTGIKKVAGQASASLKIFPNPNQGTFSITFLTAQKEHAQIIIRNVLGESIAEMALPTNMENAVYLNICPGVYYLSARTEDENITVKLLVE